MKMTSARLVLWLVAATLLLGREVHATPLDIAACDAAVAEQGQMGDVAALIERGPDWGKANASPQALKRVARWIELQEALTFRCGRGRVTAEAQRAAAAADLIENPPPPPKEVVAKDVVAKDGAAKDAAAAAKEAAAAAREAAVAAKDAAAAASSAGVAATRNSVAKVKAPAGAEGTASGGGDEAVKPLVAKPKPKSKPRTEPADGAGAMPAGDAADAPPPKKKKIAKPDDSFVPPPSKSTPN